jgi:hypothetical protein
MNSRGDSPPSKVSGRAGDGGLWAVLKPGIPLRRNYRLPDHTSPKSAGAREYAGRMAAGKSKRKRSTTFADARRIALSMPEVEETTAYGLPWFKAGKTRFAGRPALRRDVDPDSIAVVSTFEERDALIATRPDVYYVTEHFAPYPAALARLSKMRLDELRELLSAAWRHAMEHESARKKKRRAPRVR